MKQKISIYKGESAVNNANFSTSEKFVNPADKFIFPHGKGANLLSNGDMILNLDINNIKFNKNANYFDLGFSAFFDK